jgi:signal transduction histidine kinase
VVLLDPTLERRTDILDAAVRAAALNLENARLHAELLAQLQELARSRTRIVEAGVVQRRQVERDLHDGAQQRLLALAATIGRARNAADDPAVRALMEQARGELRQALQDLRDLARGIHPAVLTERGLAPAIAALADRAPVEVEVVEVPEDRFPAAAEATAYFTVAEALTNVAKYADATHATVRLARANGGLQIEVRDDGKGGAQATPGSGLAGLADRVGALDGVLEVESPPGEGTLLRAVLPL